MADLDQERTEQPTPKRLEEARKRGQVPRSTDLNAAAVVMVASAGLYFLGSSFAGDLLDLMRSGLTLNREVALDENSILPALHSMMLHALLACVPVLGLTLLAALLAPLTIGGWNISSEALMPQFSRLNPAAGFKRMFSARGVVELVKAFAKFAVVAIVAVLFLWKNHDALLSLGTQPVSAAIGHAVSLSGQAMLVLAASLALIAAVDVPWQLWQHSQQLKMSRQEIREELKESDGSPEIKQRIRSAQQELARRRMMQEVPKADVVVVNPTHFAVALRYDEKRMRAPVVVAKGADEVAARIRDVATENLVPIFEAPPLARALYRNVDIGSPIPASLYVAVAQVLTYVYQLRTARKQGGPPPQPPSIDPTIDQTRH
jgi:flagellar biosynthetic protein FlhB